MQGMQRVRQARRRAWVRPEAPGQVRRAEDAEQARHAGLLRHAGRQRPLVVREARVQRGVEEQQRDGGRVGGWEGEEGRPGR